MRSTYARAQARHLRWQEEIAFLKEEMRRGPEFLLWKATWWLERMERRVDVSSDLRSGLRAYAARQATIFATMAKRLVQQFRPVLLRLGLHVEWSQDLLEVVDGAGLQFPHAEPGATQGHGATPGHGATQGRGATERNGATARDDRLPVDVPRIAQLNIALDIGEEDSDSSSSEDGIGFEVNSDGYESEF